MIRMALFVGLGGFFGSIGRYFIYQYFLKLVPGIQPMGTLVVNVLGSFLLGLLIHATSKMDRSLYLLLTAGFCGGFTTFSTFSFENIDYLSTGNIGGAALYMSLSLILGLGACFLGWYLGKTFIGI